MNRNVSFLYGTMHYKPKFKLPCEYETKVSEEQCISTS